jgi:predicted esterase
MAETDSAAGMAGDADRADAIATCRARNALLTDRPSEQNTAQWFYDLAELAEEVALELEQLEAGRNPYARRTGDYWCVLRRDDREIPLRIFAPAQITQEPDQPRPLMLAFHGAGGDENLFFRGYGAGRIRILAEQRGVIVATPLTTAFLRDPGAFDALLERLRREYVIDEQRIYVIGHSLGCAPTAQAATRRADVVAAACCLAGSGDFTAGERIAPTLVLVGENDPISPPARVEGAAARAVAAGRPVEFRRIERVGHTLMVGPLLPEVFDWLLARTRSGG